MVAKVAGMLANVGAKMAPGALEKATALLRSATSGRVAEVSEKSVASYVGKDPRKLQVVAEQFMRAGMPVEQYLSLSDSPDVEAVRSRLMELRGKLEDEYAKGEGQSVLSSQLIAGDITALKARVEAVIKVFGDVKTYYLCMPTGGIPRAEFQIYAEMTGRPGFARGI